MLAFFAYSLLIVAVSLIGGCLPLKLRLTHRGMEVIISGVAGVMLGICLLHLLPHAAAELSSFQVGYGVLIGFLAMFFLERFCCFHHHELPGAEPAREELQKASSGRLLPVVVPTALTPHAQGDACGRGSPSHSAHRLRWGGAAIGLTLHTLTEGVALGASMLTSRHNSTSQSLIAGFGIFLVIFLHKPFDALTLSTLMSRSNWPLALQHAMNAAFALLVPVGGLFLYLADISLENSQLVSWALAFSGGAFLCISLSDLLPELQFHQHDRWKLSLALLAGILLAGAVAVAERQLHQAPAGNTGTSPLPRSLSVQPERPRM